MGSQPQFPPCDAGGVGRLAETVTGAAAQSSQPGAGDGAAAASVDAPRRPLNAGGVAASSG